MSRGYNRTGPGGYSKKTLGQKWNDVVMSKPVGKVLDSKIGKGMVGIGNAITAPLKWAGKQIQKEMEIDKAKDDKYRKAGEKLNAEYSGRPSSFKYGIQKRKVA